MSILSNILNTITLGDSLEVLKTLPDQSVDLILTSLARLATEREQLLLPL